jgi:hypothetical protein
MRLDILLIFDYIGTKEREMTLEQLVEERISSAYENGYEPEIKDLTDEELAQDLYDYLDTEFIQDSAYTYEEILAAVKEFRK